VLPKNCWDEDGRITGEEEAGTGKRPPGEGDRAMEVGANGRSWEIFSNHTGIS
jgi:hypothetical protein